MPGERTYARSRPFRVDALVAALPWPLVPPVVARFLPSRRSFAAGIGLLAAAGAAYLFALHSSTFAISHIIVRGAQPIVRAEVRRELAPLRGTSLLHLDGTSLERRVAGLPTIVSATYDRSFPHTLRVTVVAEAPVAVVHRGLETWLVSGRGRVLRQIAPGTRSGLPRVWVPRATAIAPGAYLDPGAGGIAVQALALAGHFPARIETAAVQRGELVLRLRSGVALLLGDPNDVRLKLAIARRTLPQLPHGSTYLDVSVPGRPVAGTALSALQPTQNAAATTTAATATTPPPAAVTTTVVTTTTTVTITNPQLSGTG